MNCRDARRRLDDPAGVPGPEVRAHLEECELCAELAARLEDVRGALRSRHAGVSPDPHFATRVAAGVSEATTDLVGWAALRLLPGALMLVLVLSWLVLSADSSAVAGTAPSEDLLNWVVAQSEALP